MADKRYSIIVLVGKNILTLQHCITELIRRSQGFGAELFLVTNGSGEHVEKFVSSVAQEEWATQGLDIYPILGQENQGVLARNKVLDKCSGELVCFIDDDTFVQEGWLPKFSRHFSLDKGVGFAGIEGWLVIEPDSPDVSKPQYSFSIVEDGRMTIGSEVDVVTLSMAMFRNDPEVSLKLPENFKEYGYDDVFLSFAMLTAGYKGCLTTYDNLCAAHMGQIHPGYVYNRVETAQINKAIVKDTYGPLIKQLTRRKRYAKD